MSAIMIASYQIVTYCGVNCPVIALMSPSGTA
jgi:hypothetical protein